MANLIVCFLCLFVGLPYASVGPVHGASVKPANHGLLKKEIGRFQLTGNAHSTLKEVNGGKLCVNAFGKTPPGWYFSAQVSLEECANLASVQPSTLGFRWGRSGFDYEHYKAHAMPNSKASDESGVDLARLFPGTDPFGCTIFVGEDSRGQPMAFRTSNLTSQLGVQVADMRDGPAREVCFQRWTMTQFFKPRVSELWFCYMPREEMNRCTEKAAEFYFQGQVFIGLFLILLGALGFIMRDMPEFETPLVWFSRLLLNLELGLLCVGFLLLQMEDTESFTFFLAAWAMNIGASIVVFLPYHLMERLNEDSPFNTAYLLLVAFSPCFLLEFASYWSHFIVLVDHLPLAVGGVAFITKTFAIRYLGVLVGDDEEDTEDQPQQVELPENRSAYRSVPTEEDAPQKSCMTRAPCGRWGNLTQCV
jgi:hypothetical protein